MKKKDKKVKKCKGQDLFPHIQIQPDRFPGFTVVEQR